MKKVIENKDIKKAIIRSQHCQRNFDLTQSIPQEDMDLLMYAATQCPSKQNIAFYKVHFITNREIIENVYSHTDGFLTSKSPTGSVTNSQVLANLLIAFEEYDFTKTFTTINSNLQASELLEKGDEASSEAKKTIERDKNIALGIAAGYLNLTASLLGYSTGCCNCFGEDTAKAALGFTNKPILLMGIGFKDSKLNRRVHHMDHNFIFPTKSKQTIPLEIVA
jgi:hypothetical protein